MPFVCSYQCRFMTRTYRLLSPKCVVSGWWNYISIIRGNLGFFFCRCCCCCCGGFWFRGVSGYFFFFLRLKLRHQITRISLPFHLASCDWFYHLFFSWFFNLFGKLDSDCDIVFLTSWPRHIDGVRTIYTNRWPYSPATDISTTWCRTSETRHCSVYSSTVDYSATGPYTAGSATTVHRKSSVPNTTVLREYSRNKTRVSSNLGNRSLGGEDPLKLSPSSLRVAVPSRPSETEARLYRLHFTSAGGEVRLHIGLPFSL